MARDRLKQLARNIDALVEKDDRLKKRAEEIAVLRCKAAYELHALCLDFVASVNSMLTQVTVELTPPEFSPAAFRDSGVNLFQINAKGRIIQIAFEATDTPTSVDNFRVPYILQGAIRWYNQELLDSAAIREEALFFCLDKQQNAWNCFDPRTHRSGLLDRDHLIDLMEQLI